MRWLPKSIVQSTVPNRPAKPSRGRGVAEMREGVFVLLPRLRVCTSRIPDEGRRAPHGKAVDPPGERQRTSVGGHPLTESEGTVSLLINWHRDRNLEEVITFRFRRDFFPIFMIETLLSQ